MGTITTFMDTAACDWLSLTTHNRDGFDYANRIMVGYAVSTGYDVVPGTRMQYKGRETAGMFVGEAQQGGKAHYFVQMWGSAAHRLGVDIVRDQDFAPIFKCTRIDVQWTSPRAHTVDLPAMGTLLRRARSNEWKFTGRRPRIDFYDNQDGKHTLYVGSRQSLRFLRIYNKPFEDGLHCRVEYEFKGDLAEAIRLQWQEEGDQVLAKVLHSEWFAIPDTAALFVPELADLDRLGGDRITVDYSEPDLTATANWVSSAVCPAVERLMKTKYAGVVAEELLIAMGMIDSNRWIFTEPSRDSSD